MNAVDFVLLALLAVAVFFALRHMQKMRKSGCACGNAGGCTGNCASCRAACMQKEKKESCL